MNKFLDAFWNAMDMQKEEIAIKIAHNLPLYFGSLLILLGGIVVAYITFKLTIVLYNKLTLGELIDRLEDNFFNTDVEKKEEKRILFFRKKEEKKKLTETIRLDRFLAKAMAYYIFLVFFRLSIKNLGITEIESFLSELLTYLPNLFIGVLIGFFGLRFADTVYDIIYNTLSLGKQKMSAIIAMGGKISVIFLTLMLVLHYTKILDPFIINAIFIGFIAMLTISLGIAFGLGGTKTAEEILDNLKK